MVDDAEVVADEDERQPQFRAKLGEEVEDLGADGNVEAGNRFVGDEHLRAERQRAGDADTLALSAGELARQTRGEARAEADALHQAIAFAGDLLGRDDAMGAERLLDRAADRHPRIERRVRILKHHLQPRPNIAGMVDPGQVLAAKKHPAAVGPQQADHHARERRLPAAELADDAKRLPRDDREADAGERPKRLPAPQQSLAPQREGFRNVHHLDDRRGLTTRPPAGPGPVPRGEGKRKAGRVHGLRGARAIRRKPPP